MRLVAPLLAALLLLSSPGALGWVAGWDRPHHADLAVKAARRLPPEWRDLILAHEDAFRKGALDPDGVTDASKEVNSFFHTYQPGSGGGGGLYRVQASLHDATMAKRDGKTDEGIAYQMGFLTHFVADLAMPFHTAPGAYGNEWHLSFERDAYDHRGEYAISAGAPPHEITDVKTYTIHEAEASAALAPGLVKSLDASQGAWTPEARDIAKRAADLAVDSIADMLFTAFAQADPSRPEPTFTATPPAVREPEDIGLPPGAALARHAVAVGAAAVGAFALVALVVMANRHRRKGRREG
ncbi:MAG TPA: hypothetical protein VM370_08375 [Candidatus Thermoplasmatota archaeon]|nr:hypothetical protein [Candidatus Thermoplasmatota archaeon]